MQLDRRLQPDLQSMLDNVQQPQSISGMAPVQQLPTSAPQQNVAGDVAKAGLTSGAGAAAMGVGMSAGLATAGVTAGAALVGGLMAQRAARKRQKAQLQAQAHANIGAIRQQEGAQKQQALQSIVANLRQAFTF